MLKFQDIYLIDLIIESLKSCKYFFKVVPKLLISNYANYLPIGEEDLF
jgi:hypothetical protein